MSSLVPTIRMLLEDFHNSILPDISRQLVRRDLSLGAVQKPRVGATAKVVVGMRRSGKTFRMYQEILDLMTAGVDRSHICYFNFDDDRLRPYPEDIIGCVLETFYELHPEARRDGAYVFLDEAQDVEGWDVTVRRILDTEKVALYVTGSSSKLLAEDIATELRGRSISYELLPYSFREFLRGRGVEPTSNAELLSKEVSSLLKGEFRSYLTEGGFPAAQSLDVAERTQLLQSYAQLTVARDVVERIGFSNVAYARTLARVAITSSARDVSISRLDNRGKSSGYTPGRAKIAQLLDAFEDAHLAYQVYEFGYSAQKIRLGGLKLYAADPGLYWASSIATDDSLTYALETAIYLELRRRRSTGRLGDISMLKLSSGKEVDFIEGDASTDIATSLVQACFDMESEKTRVREISALAEAMRRFNQPEGTIVTIGEEAEVALPEGTVHIVPAWKWFLS